MPNTTTMSTPLLSKSWHLETTPSANSAPYMTHLSSPQFTPPNFNLSFINSLLLNRIAIHSMSGILSNILDSYSCPRGDSLSPFYTQFYNRITGLQPIAEKRGITIPPYPAVSANWHEGATVDSNTIDEALTRHVEEPVRRILKYTVMYSARKGTRHWSSGAAQFPVGLEAYLGMMETTKSSGAGGGIGWGRIQMRRGGSGCVGGVE